MGSSSLSFANLTQTKLYVAYMRLDWDCQNECGDPWDVLGWINLDPGQTQSRANPTSNRWFYFYAEDANGLMWSGPYVAEVNNDRFEKCTCLGVVIQNGDPTNPYYDVGFRELDTDEYSGVNFID